MPRTAVVRTTRPAASSRQPRCTAPRRIISFAAAQRHRDRKRILDLDAREDKYDQRFAGMLPLEDPGVTAFGDAFYD